MDVANDQQSAFSDSSYNGKRYYNLVFNDEFDFCSHATKPNELAQKDSIPLMQGELVAVENYLNLPYRTGMLDRLLVEILIAAELYGCAWHAIGKNPISGHHSPPHNLPTVRGFLFDNIVSGSLLIGAPIAFISYLTEQMGATNLAWMSGLLFALFCFELIRSIKHFRKSRRLELPEQKDSIYENLQKIYAKLDEAGEVSAIRIRELVTKATKAGVIWSEQLVPLLDDIIKRTGQLGPDYQMASGSKLLAKPSAASEGAD